MYDFHWNELIENVKRISPKTVILQFPEGLKPHGRTLSKKLEKEVGCLTILSADPCYGACDLALESMSLLKADLLIHFGHTEMKSFGNPPVIHVEVDSVIDIRKPVSKAITVLKEEGSMKVGLASTIQHVRQLPSVKRILEKAGFKVYIGKAGGNVRYDGQVLGCDFETVRSIAERVDVFLVISGGEFHGIGVQLATGKRTIVLDPYSSKTIDLTEKGERVLKIRKAVLGKLLQSRKVGIIVGLKHGQRRFQEALNLKKALEKEGMECTLLCAREVTAKTMDSFTDLDILVNTACPRIAIDDGNLFYKPMVNLVDAMTVLRSTNP